MILAAGAFLRWRECQGIRELAAVQPANVVAAGDQLVKRSWQTTVAPVRVRGLASSPVVAGWVVLPISPESGRP
jgi:hypothetical protein